jgi:hypothetical protein
VVPLGKVADMQPKPTIEPSGSPVPGVIPEPVRVHHDTIAAHGRLTASGTTKPASLPGRRNPASIVLAKLLSAMRGDKHMVDAYPPAWQGAVAARAADDITQPSRDGEVASGVLAGVASEPDIAAIASRTKER